MSSVKIKVSEENFNIKAKINECNIHKALLTTLVKPRLKTDIHNKLFTVHISFFVNATTQHSSSCVT